MKLITPAFLPPILLICLGAVTKKGPVVTPPPAMPVLVLKASPSHPLKPGLYQSAPFSGLVLVPGPHPDDRAIIAPQETSSSMPAVKPELRLIPRAAIPSANNGRPNVR